MARDTPATKAARAAGIEFALHEYVHDPRAEAYGLEAAEALGLEIELEPEDLRRLTSATFRPLAANT
jgi:prolyl-tRNA editing enzyme YbaK/EbsC (Cys-tRNA(Pro) deacylase)